MESIDVDGLRIAYERAGAGPALVLAHGYGAAEDLRSVLPGVGHVCNVEAPELFNDAVRAFLYHQLGP